MTTIKKITHLILIEGEDQIGMDGIVKIIAESLQGDVIEIREVTLPTPVLKRYARVKKGTSVNVRITPDKLHPALLSIGYDTGDHLVLDKSADGKWIKIRVANKTPIVEGWISAVYADILSK